MYNKVMLLLQILDYGIKRGYSPNLLVFHRIIKIKNEGDKYYKLARQVQKSLKIQP